MKFFSHKARQITLAYLFLVPALLIIGIFQFYPMLQAFGYSFTNYTPLDPDTDFVGFKNFYTLLKDSSFWLALGNSLKYLLVVPAIIIFSLSLSLLVEPKIPGIHFFRACYYIPVVTMMVVVALAWKLIFNTDYGILNRVLMKIGLIDEGVGWLTNENLALFTVMTVTIWKGLGYYMVIFIVGLKSVSRDMLEAALIDGATRWQTLLFVKIPALWPTITLVAIISSIAALQVFEEIYIMTNGQIGTSTLVFEIFRNGFSMQSGGGMEMGYACAIGVVLFGLVFIFSLFTIKTMEKFHSTGAK